MRWLLYIFSVVWLLFVCLFNVHLLRYQVSPMLVNVFVNCQKFTWPERKEDCVFVFDWAMFYVYIVFNSIIELGKPHDTKLIQLGINAKRIFFLCSSGKSISFYLVSSDRLLLWITWHKLRMARNNKNLKQLYYAFGFAVFFFAFLSCNLLESQTQIPGKAHIS